MSAVRWTATTTTFVLVAGGLRWLGPEPGAVRSALADPQRLVDTAGPDALVLVAVTALAWACWAWGALGLLLTAASAAPGLAGRAAGVLLRGVLPAGARRAAAIAIGVGLSTAAPIALPAGASPLVTASAETNDPGPDWSSGSPGPVVQADWPGGPEPDLPGPPPAEPDRPGPAAGEHVVLRGDCLWDIARDWLAGHRPGHPVADAEIASAVHAWWQTNAAVIGPDPDLLLPGQVLRPPT
jgi:nucleoid-associated protein YgaU